jgi:hypothetical protein
MRRYFAILFAGLLIAAIASPTFAWEFSMKGEHAERLIYISQTGPNGLFGNMAVQDGGSILGAGMGLAGPNYYGLNPAILQQPAQAAGPSVVRAGFSGFDVDARYHQTKTTLRPTIRVNKALRVFGVYTIGGYRNINARYNSTTQSPGTPPFERWYTHRTSNAAYLTAAVGSWEQFRAVAQTPWAVLSYGIKDFPFGTGCTLAYNTRADAFLAVVPYGPFRFLCALWLARGTGDGWAVTPDAGLRTEIHEGWAVTYDNGPLSFGAITVQIRDHTAPRGPDSAALPNNYTASDAITQQYGIFSKYNNGRFFMNAEYFWATVDGYSVPNADQAGYTDVGQVDAFREGYHSFLEAGVTAGPSKLSLLWAQSSGAVLNNQNVGLKGIAATAPPAGVYNNPKVYIPLSINYQAMENYNYLMFYTYGGGNDTYNADGHGEMSDAFCFSARVDYAVASNLNVWGSYLWAHRLEKAGYLFGGKNPLGGADNGTTDAGLTNFANAAGKASALPVSGADNAIRYGFPSDGFLGWEVNFGVDWKLLEGLTWTTRYAYWQPGEWFEEAYQAVLPGADESGGTWGAGFVGPLKGRDAIHAFKGALVIDF